MKRIWKKKERVKKEQTLGRRQRVRASKQMHKSQEKWMDKNLCDGWMNEQTNEGAQGLYSFSDIHKLPVCYCCGSVGMLCEVYVFRILLKYLQMKPKQSMCSFSQNKIY